MMRRPLTTLVLVSVCGLIALAAVAALGAGLVRDGRRDAAAPTAKAGSRVWPLTLSPAPDDLALAQVSFHVAHRGRLPKGSVRVAVSGPFGADYLAVATPGFATPGAMRALVLVVDRPSPLLDPASVRLRVDAWRSLGVPGVRTLENPFAQANAASRPALCDLPLHGSALAASELTVLTSRGSPLAGFNAAGALAQAYDLACGLPHASAFEQAVEHPSSSSPTPLPPGSPTPAPPAPSPGPPVGKLPGEGCVPKPGYACPG